MPITKPLSWLMKKEPNAWSSTTRTAWWQCTSLFLPDRGTRRRAHSHCRCRLTRCRGATAAPPWSGSSTRPSHRLSLSHQTRRRSTFSHKLTWPSGWASSALKFLYRCVQIFLLRSRLETVRARRTMTLIWSKFFSNRRFNECRHGTSKFRTHNIN